MPFLHALIKNYGHTQPSPRNDLLFGVKQAQIRQNISPLYGIMLIYYSSEQPRVNPGVKLFATSNCGGCPTVRFRTRVYKIGNCMISVHIRHVVPHHVTYGPIIETSKRPTLVGKRSIARKLLCARPAGHWSLHLSHRHEPPRAAECIDWRWVERKFAHMKPSHHFVIVMCCGPSRPWRCFLSASDGRAEKKHIFELSRRARGERHSQPNQRNDSKVETKHSETKC
jgi:hypothetical protein